jgi:hypothetical protein
MEVVLLAMVVLVAVGLPMAVAVAVELVVILEATVPAVTPEQEDLEH